MTYLSMAVEESIDKHLALLPVAGFSILYITNKFVDSTSNHTPGSNSSAICL